MDHQLFLQHVRDLPLEDGRAYIRDHLAELADHQATGELMAEEALRILYTPFPSLKIAELLIFYGEITRDLYSHALGLKAKGDALMAVGHYRTAMDALDTARDEFRLLGDEGNAARSRISWTISAAWIGRVEDALQEAAHAREIFLQLGESYWAGVIDSNLAGIYAYIGRYQDAATLYEKMLAVYATASDQSESSLKRSIAIAQANHARNLIVLGDFQRAYSLLEQSQVNFYSLGEMALVVSVEENLAELDYTQGYYGSALRRYYQARDTLIHSCIDSPVLLAGIKLNTANSLVKLNRAKEACLLSQEAVEAYRQAGLSFNTGSALRDHAAALLASGRPEEALSALKDASALFTRGRFEPYVFATKLQQAQIFLEMGSTAEAYTTALLVKGYCDAHGLIARAVYATLIMAEALVRDAQDAEAREEQKQQTILLEKALSFCKQAIVLARQHNLQEELYKGHYLIGRIYSLQEKFSGAARHYRASIAQIERMLDDLVYDLSPSFLRTTWSVYEDMIALCLSQARYDQAFGYLEQARSMALRQYLRDRAEEHDASSSIQANSALILRTQQELNNWQERYRDFSLLLAEFDTTVSPDVDREVIQTELKQCEETIGELFERLYLYQSGMTLKPSQRPGKECSHAHQQQVDIAQLHRSLTPGQALLAYYSYQDKLAVFVVTAEGLVTRELTGGMEQVERLLPLLHAHLDPKIWPDPHNPPQQVVRRLLKKLYDLLVEPVADLLPPSSGHITIVPYGPLHKLPFHALYDGSHFLVEQFQLNYLPASSLLMRMDSLKSDRSQRLAHLRKPDRSPLVLGYSENGYIHRVREEAETIAALLHGRCYLESEATIAHLIEQSPGSPVIHLATHGKSRLDAPNFSYVRLADGQINAIDAFSLDLRGCELVTLSGCETGLSLSGGGDEQLGLGRAFLAAGVSSLVISLWPVEDNATNELMQLFYEGLLRGESKVEALGAAQCSLLRRTGTAFTHPYFWAAFRLVGDVGRLQYEL